MTLRAKHSGATIAVLTAFFAAGVAAFAAYGWIVNGSAIFLAMSESLAAWCM
jgi:hypothetical protein